LEIIRKIEARGAFEMAKRVKNHCSEIFQYGIAEGKCRRDPATDIRRALMKARPKQHRAALRPSEFPTFLASLKNYDGDEVTKLALRFTLLCISNPIVDTALSCVRTGLGAQPSKFS
jgi:integrase